MGLRCKRCGSEEQVKNGLLRSKQRYRCKGCGLNFTDRPARGKPLALKATAVLLYVWDCPGLVDTENAFA
jgi:transposase